MEIVKFIGLLALTWLFVEGSQPIQFLKKLVKVHPELLGKDLFRQVISKLLSCCLCSGWWIGLIYYQNILLACVTSISAELFARVLNYLFNKVFNQV